MHSLFFCKYFSYLRKIVPIAIEMKLYFTGVRISLSTSRFSCDNLNLFIIFFWHTSQSFAKCSIARGIQLYNTGVRISIRTWSSGVSNSVTFSIWRNMTRFFIVIFNDFEKKTSNSIVREKSLYRTGVVRSSLVYSFWF